jgi:hypothetical protein
MTLSDRNIFFKAGIAFSALCTLGVLAASFKIIPAYSTIEENVRRPAEFFQVFISRFLPANYFAVHTSLVFAVLFPLVTIILIHYFFEHTQVPEILYITFFAWSLSFEAVRIVVPLHIIHEIPSLYLLIASRIVLFSRYIGLFSLFTASICAAGYNEEKSRNTIMILVIATLIITMGIPIDTQTWDSSMNMISGYNSMFRMMEVAALIATVISFLIAINIRGSKEYAYIGIGALFVLIGRDILLSADNWASPFAGILLLSAGIWFICSKLHKIHLWL